MKLLCKDCIVKSAIQIILNWNTFLHLWFYQPWVFCPSVKQKSYQTALQQCPGPRSWAMFQTNKGRYKSLMSRCKLILALTLSILFSKDWTLVSRILGRGGLWALFLSLHTSAFPMVLLDPSPRGVMQVAIVLLRVPKNLQWPRWVGA